MQILWDSVHIYALYIRTHSTISADLVGGNKHFFLKISNLIINWLILFYATLYWLKDCPHHLTKYEGKGTKISILKLYCELGKIWKFRLGFSQISIFHLFSELGKTWIMNYELGSILCRPQPRPTFQNPSFKSMDELGKVMS